MIPLYLASLQTCLIRDEEPHVNTMVLTGFCHRAG